MPGASERIAAKLAAQKAKANGVDADNGNGVDEADAEDTEVVAEAPAKGKRLTPKERQAARRAAKQAQADAEDAEAEEDEEVEEADSDDEEAEASGDDEIVIEAKVEKGQVKSAKVLPKAKGKKTASPAQLAAREKFAAASRARAAAKANAGNKSAAAKPVQTPDDVRAKQNAARKAKRAEQEETEAARPQREKTSKPKAAQETKAQAKARAAKEKAEAARVAKASGAKATKATKAPKGESKNKPAGETKAKVLALAAKGKTRRQIMDELDLSYASVMYHTRGVATTTAARGSIFVETGLDENGKKLRNGKKVQVSRSEAMRRMYLSGESTGDIGRAFGVRYQIAYTAIRPLLAADDADEE